MKNTFGSALSVTVFGESHGSCVGAVLDGIAPGIEVSEEYISKILTLRRPSGAVSTARAEQDKFEICSGVFNGRTTGAPVCIIIPNSDTRSKDYDAVKTVARPSHADYTAYCKYHGFADYRGGGHFSGRVTVAICAVGAIVLKALEDKGIFIGTHIKTCQGISDRDFLDYRVDINALYEKNFPVLDEEAFEKIKGAILSAASEGDSVGAMLETAVIGLDAGLGEPFFDSAESVISHAVFSVPAVKGIEFGMGFEMCGKKGTQVNDPFAIKDKKIYTLSNNSGGINGGITNSMPVIFRTAVRPTPTISKSQKTVDFVKMQDTEIASCGRHDPCVAHRARIAVDAVTALAVADLIAVRFGTDWLGER